MYLDCAATTPVDPRVAARMAECLTLEGSFGNPGSTSHAYGRAADALVETARAQVAAAVGAHPTEIIWTSGATEANNLALFGVANHHRESGRHIVTVRTEHKAVLDPCRELERRGWRVTYLVPGPAGVLDPALVAAALEPDTILVSVMHVNNEIGAIQPVAAIAGLCARHGRAFLHVDAAQSVGKAPLDFAGMAVDLMSLSAHKAYGPKGIGALVVSRRRGVHLQPLFFGGGQERHLRPGTLATHQAVGMGAAFELAVASVARDAAHSGRLRDRLWRGLDAQGGVLRNGRADQTVPQMLNVSIEGVEGESLLAEIRPSIAVSTGSACTSSSREPSYVLRALGRDERLAESSLRFSLGRFSTDADVDTALESVSQAVRRLRGVAGYPGGRPSGDPGPAERCRPDDPSKDYNDLTRVRFAAAAMAGALDGPDVRRGTAGSPGRGTWVRFDLRLAADGKVPTVTAARFLAFGCPHVIAVADWLSQLAVGRAAEPVLPESIASLRERFEVPTEKLGRLLIVEDAWISAMSSPP